MNELVDSSSAQYAVIEALRAEDPPELFVIAYHDEESLRDLIAAPCIRAFGFASREEAVASTDACRSVAAAWKQSPRARVVDGAKRYQRGVHSAKRRFGDEFSLAKTRRIARRVLQQAVAAAILIFYSRNAASAAIRTFIGASF